MAPSRDEIQKATAALDRLGAAVDELNAARDELREISPDHAVAAIRDHDDSVRLLRGRA